MTFMQRIEVKLPWLTLVLAGLMVGWFAAFGPAPGNWVYDRDAIADGEALRLLSAHWVHADLGHLAWNLGALLLLGWIVESWQRHALWIGLLAGSLAVDLMVWLALPEMTHYCGLSGALNTLLLLALLACWQRTTAWALLVTGALSLLKILVEANTGQALFTQAAWASVPLAHLGGWLAGLTCILGHCLWPKSQPMRPIYAAGTSALFTMKDKQ